MGTLSKQNKRVDMEAEGAKLLLPMDNMIRDSNKQNKCVNIYAGNHTRKDKPAASSSTGRSKKCNVSKQQKQMLHNRFIEESPYSELENLNTEPWWVKVIEILNVVRLRELTEENPKTGLCEPTRFCELGYNIAFFDFDKESKVVHGPLFREIPPSEYRILDDSVNVISIKVLESDVGYPINVYGTVLARDVNDLRCVYLFKRGRDDPQLITEKNQILNLTGPYRALGGTDNMYFEINLKIKGDEEADQDFSKGLVVHRCYTVDVAKPNTFSLSSYLSTVQLMYIHVSYALEASIGINFLNGKSTFTGKIFASTSGSYTTKMVLYDSEVAGSEIGNGGSVLLSRDIVAVPFGEDLSLYFWVHDNKSECFEVVIENGVDERTCDLGTYKVQIKIIWKGVFRQKRTIKDYCASCILLK
ncbi:unnamed protein product [Urochloa humidicola]